MASPPPPDDRPEPEPDREREREPDRVRDYEPDGRPPGPTHIEDVPWFRKNSFCSAVLVAHVFVMCLGGCIPFASLIGVLTTIGVIAVCGIVLTGPVYYSKRKKDGTLRTWSKGNKIAAVILLVLFVGGYASLIAYLVLSGKFGG